MSRTMLQWTYRAVVFLLLGTFVPGLLCAGEILDESWFAITLGPDYFGYLHSLLERTQWQGKEVVATTEYMEFTLARMGMEMKASMKSEYIDDLELEPVYFRSEMNISAMQSITEGYVKGREIDITQTMGGQTQKHAITLDEDTIFPSAKFREAQAGKFSTGSKHTFQIFIPDFLTVVKTTVHVIGPETIVIEGTSYETLKAISRSDVTSNTPTTEWIDQAGNIIQFETEMMGSTIKGIKTTREKAVQSDQKAPSLDIFRDLLIKPNEPILEPEQAQSARFQLTFKKAPDQYEMISDTRQHVISREQDQVILQTHKIALPAETGLTLPVKDPALSAYLEPSSFIQSDDPKIKAQAEQICGDERDLVRAAQKINTWVFENIKKKNLNVGFASASEVVNNLEGDCSEHSVLATALCQAIGIPARLCMGLMYSPQMNAFGYHLWFEIHAGQWYQLDPTFNQAAVDITHITISRGNMNGSELLQASADLNNFASNMEIKVIEVRYHN
ncbi:transglutaminase domain-containing protein [bacterium]|nr:transglutaminase domain-containing protein [bacterium]